MIEEGLFSRIIDNLLEGIVLIDSAKKIIFWNQWMEQTSGLQKEKVTGKKFLDVFPDLEFTRIDSCIDLAMEKGQSSFVSHIMNPIMLPLFYFNPGAVEKSKVYHNVRVMKLKTNSGSNVLLHVTDETSNVLKEEMLKNRAKEEKVLSSKLIQEIHEKEEVESKLKLNAAIIANTTEAVVITDENAMVQEINSSFTDIMGYTREDIIGKHIKMVKSGKHDKAFYEALWKELGEKGKWKGEFINKKPDRSLIIVESSITEIKNNEGIITNYVNIFHDVTQRKKHEEELEIWSRTDVLTGLGNRRAFNEDIELQWRVCMRHGFSIGLIILDVDYFKKYNDKYGHQAGDDCLVKIANVIHTNIKRGDDKAARYGGEEFVVILTQTSEEGLFGVAEAILNDVAEIRIPHEESDVCPYVTISAGLSLTVPTNENNWSDIIDKADKALYEAKNSGRNRLVLKKV